MDAAKVLRYGIGAIFAAAVTVALFTLMFTLIATGVARIDRDSGIKIADIYLGETRIEANIKEVKPDKPVEPEQPPPELEAPRLASFDVKTAISVSFSPVANVNIGIGGLSVADGEYLPIVKVAPIYPRRAQSRGIQGYCIVEYTVTRSGAIRDARATDCKPRGMFDQASIKAALKFKYKPRVIEGEPVEVSGVRNKFTYTLE